MPLDRQKLSLCTQVNVYFVFSAALAHNKTFRWQAECLSFCQCWPLEHEWVSMVCEHASAIKLTRIIELTFELVSCISIIGMATGAEPFAKFCCEFLTVDALDVE